MLIEYTHAGPSAGDVGGTVSSPEGAVSSFHKTWFTWKAKQPSPPGAPSGRRPVTVRPQAASRDGCTASEETVLQSK